MILVPTLHPAAVLRGSSGEGDSLAKYRDTVVADLKKAIALRHRPPHWDDSAVYRRDAAGRFTALFPTVQEVYAFCDRTFTHQALLTVDVETTGAQAMDCKLICIGMCNSLGDVICVPLLRSGGEPYWANPKDERQALRAVAYLLGSPYVPKLFHNGPFDTVVLSSHGFPVARYTEDTLALHHVIDGELPHALAYCASRYTEAPYWKGSVKDGRAWLDLDDVTLRAYNCLDTLATFRIHGPMMDECRRLGLEALYREEVALGRIMAKATIRGLEVDFVRRDSTETAKDGKPVGLGPRLQIQKAEALATLQALIGAHAPGFNPRSLRHLRWLLFEKLKFPVVLRTDTGAPSTDKNALVLLGLHAESDDQKAALRALVFYRHADKMLGTWVEGLMALGDGRIHPSWRAPGTVTGRFTSSPNVQTFSGPIKRIFKAAKGHKFVSVDLSQAELRVMAYLAQDADLLRMYREGINVHTANTALLFRLKCPNPKDTNEATEAYLREAMPKLIGLDYDGIDDTGKPIFPFAPKDSWKQIRTLAKSFVFAENYGAEARTIYENIRSKRDLSTQELLFPDITLAEIEALKLTWERLHPAIPQWWRDITSATQHQGRYACPVSGRIQWYRAGFKRNELLNRPIQSFVASWMNQCMILIDAAVEKETRGTACIVQQVHDALTLEVPDAYVDTVKEILMRYLNEPFEFFLPNGKKITATLPADAPTEGLYLDEV